MSAIQVLHPDRIPKTGFLAIPGRLDFDQLDQIEKHLGNRKITYLIEEKDHHNADILAHMEKSGSGAMFSIADKNPASAGKELGKLLGTDGVLIFVPGKSTARPATPIRTPSSHLKTLTAFGLPLCPIAIDCPHESCLSIENMNSLPQAVISFGKSIPAKDSSISAFQESLLGAFEEAYSSRAILKGSLATALFKGLKNNPGDKLVDGSDDVVLPFSKILPVAIALSKHIRKETDKLRVAIVLPPGKGGMIANLAVLFAGKIPVNLNFTASHNAIRSSIRQADVDRFITADPFVRKVSSFPWPPNRDLIFIERTIPELKKDIVKWALITKFLPSSVVIGMLGLNKRRDADEAILLFTSGSSGEPKGVPLSHRNVLANVTQFASRLNIGRDSSLLGCLPLFHSFGCTVTLWYPIIEGVNLITYPSPLETKRLAELISLHQVNVLLATPTFLRGYMKRIDPAHLESLKLVVTGAEKLPQNLADAFEEKFGVRPMEGYGLTETSPATNVNLPSPDAEPESHTIAARMNGSVGHLLPGIAIKLIDPATEKSVPLGKPGIIILKGANIFPGYLRDEKRTKEVLCENGWFKTGDVGYLDEDSFLHIQGRISRFSKIAGEMVPHETIEAAINKVLGLDGETERKIAIVGVPDDKKGEAIILLSTIAGPALEQECIDLRYKLLDEGLTSLWCPKLIIPVAEIPLLASGKLDIKSCQELAG
ncbi:MAG: AMP-binding protein [Akkermansiaceae bacterium]|nr:AMP-binding protein [Akkermansiaceae bacterium]MDP4646766.1 AMP-binding protein [Akkermansiaceae bacterium]MDP4720669.1 AMP-binding protein [Akkermansiaceae bacterium]MDP4779683.1 AMP-binding protein [Akkermansiaceae bacterium]MDP4846659.1 AMP-binding protein [Akkermansiaceae bacterium]